MIIVGLVEKVKLEQKLEERQQVSQVVKWGGRLFQATRAAEENVLTTGGQCGWKEGSHGEISRGELRGANKDQITQGLTGRCEDFVFYSERNGDFLQDFTQGSDMILLMP